MNTKILITPLAGIFIGFIAWGNEPLFMPISLVIIPLWYYSANRYLAWLTVLFYFAAATRAYPVAVMMYYKTNIAVASLDWLISSFLASIPFLLLYFHNRKHRIIGLYSALILIAIPPFGLTCLTHPLSSIGMVWPGGGWIALLLTLSLIPCFCRWPIILIIPIIIGLSITHTPMPSPKGWAKLDTSLPGISSNVNAFSDATYSDFRNDYFKQISTIKKLNKKIHTEAKYILLPEASGGSLWMDGNDNLWSTRLTWPGTVLVGATLQFEKNKESVVLAVSNKGTEQIYKQRQPVPVSMWWPGKDNSYLAHWFANPIVNFGDKKIAFLVCYEQFLIWTTLHSLWHKPDIICATSNLWWTKGTNIQAIQHNIMLSWSQLFSVPLLTASNI